MVCGAEFLEKSGLSLDWCLSGSSDRFDFFSLCLVICACDKRSSIPWCHRNGVTTGLVEFETKTVSPWDLYKGAGSVAGMGRSVLGQQCPGAAVKGCAL